MSSSSSSSSSTAAAAAAVDPVAAAGAAATAKAEGSAKYALIASASLKVYSVSAATASRLAKARRTLYGTEATVGVPSSIEITAVFFTAWLNAEIICESSISSTLGSKRE